MKFTALIRQEGEVFSSLCLELDVASTGATAEEAKSNLIEAIELYLEEATEEEVTTRYQPYSLVATLEVKVG